MIIRKTKVLFRTERPGEEAVSLTLPALLRIGEEKISLSFTWEQESPLHVRFWFEPDRRDLVHLTEEGAVKANWLFEEGRSHPVFYESGGYGAELGMATLRLENRLGIGGALRVEYRLDPGDSARDAEGFVRLYVEELKD